MFYAHVSSAAVKRQHVTATCCCSLSVSLKCLFTISSQCNMLLVPVYGNSFLRMHWDSAHPFDLFANVRDRFQTNMFCFLLVLNSFVQNKYLI